MTDKHSNCFRAYDFGEAELLRAQLRALQPTTHFFRSEIDFQQTTSKKN